MIKLNGRLVGKNLIMLRVLHHTMNSSLNLGFGIVLEAFFFTFKGLSMRKQFTLVEIMIVVAIIAILSAIAMPNLTANREVTFKKVREENVMKIELAKERWAMDYNKPKSSAVTFADLKNYLPFIKDADTIDVLTINGKSITIGNIGTEATYAQ